MDYGKKYLLAGFGLTTALALAGPFGASPAFAIETLVKGAPANVNPLRTPAAPPAQAVADTDPLTVKSVIVDKTADNAAAARDQALKAVPRKAFQKLAEQNMTADELKSFAYPDDKIIAGLVQGFEVKTEQIGGNRYLGSYSVRFSDAVRQYIPIRAVPEKPAVPESAAASTAPAEKTLSDANKSPADKALPDKSVVAAPSGETPPVEAPPARSAFMPVSPSPAADTPAAAPSAVPSAASSPVKGAATAAVTARKRMLVLPYFETMSGQVVLWSDANPWRDIWLKTDPRAEGTGLDFAVPLGDADDVSAGSDSAVWSGNYATVAKLASQYKAEETVLAVANKSGSYVTVDMYFFKDGKLGGRQVLQPYVGEYSQREAMAVAAQAMIEYLKQREQGKTDAPHPVAVISRSLTEQDATGTPRAVAGPPAAAPRGSDGMGTTVISSQSTALVDTLAPPEGVAAPETLAQPSTAAPVAAGPVVLDATMRFSTLAAWSDFQRRLTTLTPPVIMDLKSMTADGARFTLRYGGSLPALQSALQEKGVDLTAVAPAAVNGSSPYEVTLVR